MLLLFVLIGIGVLAAVGAVAAGWGSGLERPVNDRSPSGLPDGALTADDVERVTFSGALRGYRMDEVDAVLDRLRDELAARDARIAELTQDRVSQDQEPPAEEPAADAPERGSGWQS